MDCVLKLLAFVQCRDVDVGPQDRLTGLTGPVDPATVTRLPICQSRQLPWLNANCRQRTINRCQSAANLPVVNT